MKFFFHGNAVLAQYVRFENSTWAGSHHTLDDVWRALEGTRRDVDGEEQILMERKATKHGVHLQF